MEHTNTNEPAESPGMPQADSQPESEIAASAPEAIAETVPEPPAPPKANGDYVYFKKVLVNMPFIVNKQRVGFEVLASNTGVIRLRRSADFHVVMALEKAAEARKGGVVSITAEDYEALKKKLDLLTSGIRPKQPRPQRLQVWKDPSLSAKRVPPSVQQIKNQAGAARVAAVEGGRISSSAASSVGGKASVPGSRPGGEKSGDTPSGPAKSPPSEAPAPATARRTPTAIARPPRVQPSRAK